ncbi:MAG: carbonic anhydrase [Candidatus Zixiibacteriota bacterium]
MGNDIFVTAINCMDGRTQGPVIEFMKQKYGADHVDKITEPGPIKILADNGPEALIDSIKARVAVSVNMHGSKAIGIVGHTQCAGNPVEKDVQMVQLEKAVETVASWGFNVEIIKIWVGADWVAEEV